MVRGKTQTSCGGYMRLTRNPTQHDREREKLAYSSCLHFIGRLGRCSFLGRAQVDMHGILRLGKVFRGRLPPCRTFCCKSTT